MKKFKVKFTKKIGEIIFLIFLAVFAFVTTLIVCKANRRIVCDVTQEVQIVKNRYVVQGDLTIFKIYDEEILALKDETIVEVINPKGIVVDTAYINGDEIIVDTSLLLTGQYKIKISNSIKQVVTEDSFVVSLIAVM